MAELNFKIPEKVSKIISKFIENKAEIYIVGGAVRDLLLGLEVKDWDFTTNLTPEEMKKLFPKNSFCNNIFGTFSIVGKDKEIFEITTYRTESNYSDNRHPDKVEWGKSLEEDLQRRDFTINAMAIKLITNYELRITNNKLPVTNYELVDLYEGRKDLENKLIRAVGSADERFKEDALRMLRAIRIASQIAFTIEEKTFESIQKNAGLLKNIAGERIREELFKILVSKSPADGMKMLKNSGLLAVIMPEIMEGVSFTQKGHHIYDVWEHNLNTLASCESVNPITRLASFLHDVAKPIVAKGEGEARIFHNHDVVGARTATAIGKRLRLSNKELDQLFILVRWHMFTVTENQTDRAVRRFIKNVTPEFIDEMIALRRADRVGSGAKETSWRWDLFKKRIIEVQKQPFSINDLKIDGNDIMKHLKIKPSKKIGDILKALFKMVEDDPKLNDREKLLDLLTTFPK